MGGVERESLLSIYPTGAWEMRWRHCKIASSPANVAAGNMLRKHPSINSSLCTILGIIYAGNLLFDEHVQPF